MGVERLKLLQMKKILYIRKLTLREKNSFLNSHV